MLELTKEAFRILDLNRRDGFTIPAAKLYPFQWNWDSGFVSIGLAHRDMDQAIEEIQTLFKGQWENGMLPHIIFHSENESTYFPNFDFWNANVNAGAPNKPKTSGITQPAVHGFILEELLRIQPNNEKLHDFIKQLFPKLLNYHRFLYDYRDPTREGLMYIYHPWASGRDNSPIWDSSMDRIVIKEGDIPEYKRRDTSIADASERPTEAQYDRYVYLLKLGQKYNYDGHEIAEESPLLIQDCMMNALLIKSNQSLINIGQQFGLDTGEIEEWQSQSMKSYHDKFWNEELGVYTSYDMRTQEQIKHKEIGGMIAMFADIPSSNTAQRIADDLKSLHDRSFYLCPSFDVDSPLFDSKRYWRGPIWPHMNWMMSRGMKAYGYDELSNIIKSDTIEIVDKYGFCEYYEPQKSVAKNLTKGYGGELFSWTASSIIDLIKST